MSQLMTVILKKEWRDAIRDRRTLSTMLMIVILLPLSLYASLAFMVKKTTQDESESITLLVRNGEQAPTLMQQLKQAGITIEPSKLETDADISAKLESNKIVGLLALDKNYQADYLALRTAKMALWSNSATEQRAKLRKVERLIQRYQASAAEWRLIARGVAPSLVRPVELQEFDVADHGARAGGFLSMMFGMVFWGVFGVCSAMVIDITAGERERRTLELLMAQPASVWDVVLGKWLAASLFGLLGLGLQLLLVHFALLRLPLEEVGMSWQIGISGLLSLLLSGVPLALFASAFIMALAMNTKTFKEAQSTVGIAMIIPMVPVMAIPMLDLGTKSWMFAIPMVGHGELVKSLAKGHGLQMAEWAMLIGVPGAAALLLVVFCAMRLRSERFVVGV